MIEQASTTLNVLEEALRLSSHGVKVFPLYRVVNGVCNCKKGASCDSPGKHPTLDTFWEKATDDVSVVREFFKTERNIGILAGEENGIFMLDFDGEEGMRTLAGWRERLPPTWEVETGSGGRHLIFAHPWNLDFVIRNTVKSLGTGVDGRGEHGYTVGSGSVTNKGAYRWIYMEDDPAQPPVWLIDLMRDKIVNTPEKVELDGDDLVINWLVEPDSELGTKVGMLLNTNRQFASIVKGKVACLNASERDWALCKDMLHAGFTAQEITDFIIIFRREKRDKMKGDSYFPLTIGKAMAEVQKEKAEKEAVVSFAESAVTAEIAEEIKIDRPSRPTVKDFPIHVLPQQIQLFIKEVCSCLSVPYDFVCVHLLAVAGSAIGKSYEVEIKRGHKQFANLYCVLVGEPGTTKSSSLNKVFSPVSALQNEYKATQDQAEMNYAQDMAIYEAKKEEWKKEKRHLRGDPPSVPELPLITEVYTTQATTEALSLLLSNNPRGCILKLDELSSLLRGMNQYKGGKGSDREFYLEAWANSDIKINRKKDPKLVMIPQPFLAITGNIPPGVLNSLEGVKDEEDGFLDRFLIAYPDNQDIPDLNWNEISDEVVDVYQQVIHKLYDFPNVEKHIPLSIDAKFLLGEWHIKHNQERRDPNFSKKLRGPFSKMTNQLARVALIVHMFRHVCEGVSDAEIDEISMQGAIEIIEYFKAQARKVYHVMEVSTEETRVDEAIKWIKDNGGKVTAREMQRNRIVGCTKKSDVEELFSTLVEYGYGIVAEVTPKNGGRKTKEFTAF